MRRFIFAVFLAALVTPAGAAASSSSHPGSKKNPGAWRTYSSKKLGFSLRYPGNWKLIPSTSPLNEQVLFSYQGKTPYGLTVNVLPLGVGPSIDNTLQRFIQYQQQLHVTIFERVHWSSTSIGGRPALVGVARSPATEGGISVSDAVYLTQSQSHVYQIIAVSYHKPSLSQLRQFPAIYGQILRTWRFF